VHKKIDMTRGLLVWILLAGVLSTIGVSVFSVIYTNSVQKQAEHRSEKARELADYRWCSLLETVDVPGQVNQIKDPVQRQRAQLYYARLHQLRVELRCVTK